MFTRSDTSGLPLIIPREMVKPNVLIRLSKIYWLNLSSNTREIGAIIYQASYSSPEHPVKPLQDSHLLIYSMVISFVKYLTLGNPSSQSLIQRSTWTKKCQDCKKFACK